MDFAPFLTGFEVSTFRETEISAQQIWISSLSVTSLMMDKNRHFSLDFVQKIFKIFFTVFFLFCCCLCTMIFVTNSNKKIYIGT
jgi:hypothetical protein